jgi:hypothetical protein
MPKRSSKQKDTQELARSILDAVVPDADAAPDKKPGHDKNTLAERDKPLVCGAEFVHDNWTSLYPQQACHDQQSSEFSSRHPRNAPDIGDGGPVSRTKNRTGG